MQYHGLKKFLLIVFIGASAVETSGMDIFPFTDDGPSLLYETIDFKNEERPSYSLFEKALNGYYHLKNSRIANKSILTIIDFTRPSHLKRLWVIDVDRKLLLFHCLTAHGKNSGESMATSFSNTPNSNKSSLGFFVTGKTYIGKHGTSLKLKGLEPGINDQAEARAIVMHGADYVSEHYIKKYGRLGRSFGCPAVPHELHEKIIETVSNGSCLFIFHDSIDYNQASEFAKVGRASGDINR